MIVAIHKRGSPIFSVVITSRRNLFDVLASVGSCTLTLKIIPSGILIRLDIKITKAFLLSKKTKTERLFYKNS